MPQKLNNAGEMQNYIPAGNTNGGQYGDKETGSNKNYNSKFAEALKKTLLGENKIKEFQESLKRTEENIRKQKELIEKNPNDNTAKQNLKDYEQSKERLEKSFENSLEKGFAVDYNGKKIVEKKERKTFSQYLKEQDSKDKAYFFGGEDNYKMTTAKYFTFKHYQSDDKIMITTKNVRYWKNRDCYVMYVGNDKVIYLKEWQIRPVRQWNDGNEVKGNIVKLDRKYFKVYNAPQNDDFAFDEEESFDDLVKVAKKQDKENAEWTFHHATF